MEKSWVVNGERTRKTIERETLEFLPPVGNGDDSSAVLSDLLENRLREIEVLKRRIAPTAIIIGETEIRRTEICGGDYNGTRETPFFVVHATDFEARTAAETVVK